MGEAVKRTTPLRRTRLRSHNPERREQRHAAQFGPQARLCRLLPCVACGRRPPSDPAHVRSRGAGGTDSDAVPLCRGCHQAQHVEGIATFQRRRGLDLEEWARRMADAVDAHACESWAEATPSGVRCAVCLQRTEEPRV